MKILGDQFVLGRTIEEALSRADAARGQGLSVFLRHAGRAATPESDAERYFERYMEAIDAIGKDAGIVPATRADADFRCGPAISVKLSALHPRFEPGKEKRLARELAPRLLSWRAAARAQGLGLTVDAEEQDRLD